MLAPASILWHDGPMGKDRTRKRWRDRGHVGCSISAPWVQRALAMAATAALLAAMGAGAACAADTKAPDRRALYEQAVETAARIDAYETYCKTPKARRPISDRILAGAARRGVPSADVKALTAARDAAAAEKAGAFADQKPDCKNVDFLFEKYVLVQKLEEQTFAIMDSE